MAAPVPTELFVDATFVMPDGVTQFLTIQAALDAAEEGATINVAAGTYTENLTITTAGITILSANAGIAHDGGRGAEAIINGSILVTGADTTLDGLTIANGGNIFGENTAIMVNTDADGLTVSNVIFDGNGQTHRGIINVYDGPTDLTVTGSSFEGWATGIYVNPGMTGLDVTGNTFDGNGNAMIIDGPGNDGDVSGNVFSNSVGSHIGMGIAAPGELDASAIIGTNTFNGTNTPTSLFGTTGNDTLTGTEERNRFFAEDGNDVIHADGNDSVYGGGGTDTLILSEGTDPADVVANAANFTGLESITITGTGGNTIIVLNGMSLQAAIDGASDGDTILVAPGSYSTAANYNPMDNSNSGSNPVGLLVNKSVTIAGVDASGALITDATQVAATVTSTVQSNWGTNFFVTAPDVTITGLTFIATAPGSEVNKAFEIVHNNFTLQHSVVGSASGDIGAVIYVNDDVAAPGPGFVSDIVSFDISTNILRGDFVLANGAGIGHETTSMVLADNEFIRNPGSAPDYNWGVIITGFDEAVAWRPQPVGPLVVTGNSFAADYTTDRLLYVRDDDAARLPSAEYVEAFIADNNIEVFAYGVDPMGVPSVVALSTTNGFVLALSAGNASYYVNAGDTLIVQSDGTPATEVIATDDLTIDLRSSGLTFVLDDGVETLTLTGDEDADIIGNADDNTITANDGDNAIAGGGGNDLITAADGNDSIAADAGNDTIDGGDGQDVLDMTAAGPDGSFVDLNAGLAFSSATGIDSIDNIENVIGSEGNDGLFGDAGANIFTATDGDDVIDGRGGSDTFDASAATTAVSANLTTGDVSGAHTATLTSIENILTGSGNDTVTGSDDTNRIETGEGSDTIIIESGSAGTDIVDGGDGLDIVQFSGARGDYTLAWSGADAVEVTHTASGEVTQVADVGRLEFSDSDVFLVSAAGTEYTTIASAVTAAASGDEIMIAEGTYAGVTVTKDLTFTGAKAGTVGYDMLTIAGGARSGAGETVLTSGFTVNEGLDVTVDGFRFENTNAINTNSGSVVQDITFKNNVVVGGANQFVGNGLGLGNVEITGNFISSATGNGLQINGAGNGQVTVSDNLFDGTGAGAAAVNANGIAEFTFDGNVVMNTHSHGIQVAGVMGTTLIDGNTFDGTVQGGLLDRGAISVQNPQNFTGTLTVSDNTVTDSPFGIVYRGGPHADTTGLDPVLSGNDFSGATQAEIGYAGTNGANALTGGGESALFRGFGDNDTITVGGGDDTVDGGAGLDTVSFDGDADDYTVAWDGTTATVTNIATGDVTTITTAGRLDFGDRDVLLVDDGSAEFATIQSAVTAAASGDRILVGAGSYAEAVAITGGKALDISGGHGGATTLTGSISHDGVLNGTLALSDMSIIATGAYGVFVSASAGMDLSEVVLDGMTISGADQNGFAYIRAGNGGPALLTDTIDAITIKNSTFTDNGDFNTGSGGRGAIMFFGFNGDAAITDTVISSGVSTQKAIQIRGVEGMGDAAGIGPYAAAGALDLSGTTITGTYTTDAIALYRIASFASVDLTGLTFNGTATFGALNPDSVGGTFDASAFTGSNGMIALSTLQGLATGDTFTGTDGIDLLDGRDGADNLSGGDGADFFRITSAAHHDAGEVMDGGDGVDTILFTASTAQTLTLEGTTTNIEAVTMTGAAALGVDASAVATALSFTGNSGNNSFVGTGADDTINGGAGVDTVEVRGAATISTDGTGWQVDSDDGTDTLSNVESVVDGMGAQTWLVGNGGFATIQEAIDAAGAGDTILIAEGIYAGGINVNKALTITGMGEPGDVVIEGTFETANGITGSVTDFLQTAASYSAVGTGMTIAASNVTLNNLTIDSFNTGIELGNGISDITLNDIDVQDGVTGIRKGTAATVTNLTINDGSLTDLYHGINFAKAVGAAGFVNGLTIDGTTFTDLGEKGIYLETGSNVLITGITMTDVGQFGRGPAFGSAAQTGEFGNGIDINLKYDNGTPYQNIIIEDFTFTNVGLSGGVDTVPLDFGGAIVIKARDDASSYNTNPATVLGAVIVRNGSIDGTSTGIRAGEPGKVNATPAVTIENVTVTNETVADSDNVTSSLTTVTLTGDDEAWVTATTTTGDMSIDGGAGSDTLSAGSGDDTLFGNSGDDQLWGSAGSDVLNGGADTDTAVYANSSFGVAVNLLLGTASGGHAAGDTLTLIENVTGSNQGDTLTGDGGANVLSGLQGNDVLNGGEGADTLEHGDGSDTLNGGAGDDTVIFDLAWDAYTITRSGSTYTVSDGTFTDVVTDVETFIINGTSIDVSENADAIVTEAAPEIVSVDEVGSDEDMDDQTYEVEENTATGTAVALVTADDPNLALGDTLTFSLVDGMGNAYTGPFTIVSTGATTAEIRVAAPGLDHEASASEAPVVRVTDSSGGTADLAVTITILDVNEAPGAITVEPGTLSVDENADGAVITSVSATDPDDGDSLTFSVDDMRFEVVDIDPGMGVQMALKLKDGQTLDFETEPTVSVTVTATDEDGLESTLDVSFDVNPINEAPGGGTPLAVWTPDAVEAGLRRAVLTDTPVILDPEGDTLTYTLTTGPAQGTFYVGNESVAVNDTLTQAQFEMLTYQAPEGAGARSAVFNVSDGTNAVALNVTLTVAAAISGTYTGTTGADVLDGGAGADTVIGDIGNDTLYGGTGSDVLNGGNGTDLMIGGAGSDRYSVANLTDEIVEVTGGGTDTVLSNVNYTLQAGVSIENLNASIAASTRAMNLTGNELSQTIRGNAGDNILDGGTGSADTLEGGAGNDTYIIRNVGDVVVETGDPGSTDTVQAAISFTLGSAMQVEVLETIDADATTAIDLTGSASAQTIIGNDGDNRLDGRRGADTLTGNDGADTFVFSTLLNPGDVKTITDFTVGVDTFELSAAIFTGLLAGPLSADDFVAHAANTAIDATDRIIYNTETGHLFYDEDGAGGVAGRRIAILDSGLMLTADDFSIL